VAEARPPLHPAQYTIAAWHHPRFSSVANGKYSMMQSGKTSTTTASTWSRTVTATTNERFAPQTATGNLDLSSDISEFIVGTCGKSQTPILQGLPNCKVRNTGTYDILGLTLHSGSYDWEFVPVSGGTFQDVGSRSCH